MYARARGVRVCVCVCVCACVCVRVCVCVTRPASCSNPRDLEKNLGMLSLDPSTLRVRPPPAARVTLWVRPRRHCRGSIPKSTAVFLHGHQNCGFSGDVMKNVPV